ncbi:unnamed protein product, partial [marine sediment metagenome]
MPLYKYRAKDGPENIVEGRIEAETEKEAIEKVHRLGYIPVRVKEETAESRLGRISGPISGVRVRSQDVTIFSRQLASFMKSGMPILRALTIISEQSQGPHLKDMFNNIRAEVRDGKTLSSALSGYPRVFSALYIAMVRTGEDSGTLQEVF